MCGGALGMPVYAPRAMKKMPAMPTEMPR